MKNLMKNILNVILILWTSYAMGCDACQLRQPEVTKDFTHGTGPESNWDWFIVGIVILITVFTFIFSVKYLIKPGEKDETHIKYSVFSDENSIL
jgi:heme/copper-type cytochrome/quinol oxidase subunit 2